MINRIKSDRELRLRLITFGALIINCIYASFNLVFGIISDSIWFVTLGAYYLVLSVMRAVCVRRLRLSDECRGTLSFVGVMLTLLCVTLMGSVVLSFERQSMGGASFFVLIVTVIYTSVKLVLAVRNVLGAHARGHLVWIAIRNISCGDAAASVISTVRVVLRTLFEGGEAVFYINAGTAFICCFVILFLGISSISLSFSTR